MPRPLAKPGRLALYISRTPSLLSALSIVAGPLVLRPITDDVLPALTRVALGGVHDSRAWS